MKKKLREFPKPPEFPKWPVEQVMEVARMLYALRPFKFSRFERFMDNKSELQWNELAQEAFYFLDKLHKACEGVSRERSLWDVACRGYEKDAAQAAKLPDLVPFEKAIRFITAQNTTERARSNFEKFVLYNRRYFGEQFGKRPAIDQIVAVIDNAHSPVTRESLDRCALTFWTLNGKIAHWRNTGVPRSRLPSLREMFKNSWKEIIAEESRAKA